MNIDVHNHAFPQEVLDLVRREDVFDLEIRDGTVRSSRYAAHDLFPSLIDPAAKLRQLEEAGLQGAVISVEPALFAYHVPLEAAELMAAAANRGLADFCAGHPDGLHWMAQVPLQSPERAAQVLEDAVAEGAVGVQIGSAAAARRPDEPEFEPFWAAAERLGVPVFVHPAYQRPNDGLDPYYLRNVIGNPLETTIFIERLISAGVLDRHPGARLLLSHAGGFFPYQAGRLRHARTVRSELASSPADPWAYTRQIYIDTISHDPQALAYLVSRAGSERVVMGTDFPYDMATPEPMSALLEAVDQGTASQIAEINPSRLFGLDRGAKV